MLANEDHCGTCGNSVISSRIEHAARMKRNKVREYKMQTDAARRYTEYINAAVKSRKAKQTEQTGDVEKQIEYYICMH